MSDLIQRSARDDRAHQTGVVAAHADQVGAAGQGHWQSQAIGDRGGLDGSDLGAAQTNNSDLGSGAGHLVRQNQLRAVESLQTIARASLGLDAVSSGDSV